MKARNLVIIVAVLAVICLPIAMMALIWSMVTGMEPIPQILHRLEDDRTVTAVTGTPLSLRLWGGSLKINDSSGSGRAWMDTTAYGPAGTMHFVARAQRSGGDAWTVTYLAIYPQGVCVVRIDADHPEHTAVETPDAPGRNAATAEPAASTDARMTWVTGMALLMVVATVVVIMVLLGSLGGLGDLRRAYPETPTEVPPLRLGSLRLGMVSYNNCIRLGLTRDALFIRWGFPIALRAQVVRVPLADLHDPQVVRAWTGSWVTCSLGAQRRKLTLPLWLFAESEAGRALIGS